MYIRSLFSRRIHTHLYPFLLVCGLIIISLVSCSEDEPDMAPPVVLRDSIPVMTTYGVSKLISDSGVIRYKIVAEEWQVYDKTNPPRQVFPKGIFLKKFDAKFHVELYITADTAYWYNQNLWELRGRVFIKNQKGVKFRTEELFWDMEKHKIYSYKYMHIIEPDQELEGDRFWSNEQMTEYEIINSAGVVPMPDDSEQTDSIPREMTKPVKAS